MRADLIKRFKDFKKNPPPKYETMKIDGNKPSSTMMIQKYSYCLNCADVLFECKCDSPIFVIPTDKAIHIISNELRINNEGHNNYLKKIRS